MRPIQIAALADLHLGYQAYAATTAGQNTREVDVETGCRAAAEVILQRTPRVDLVTIAGDIFHSQRPSNRAIIAFRDFCRTLSEAGMTVVAVAGNHEAAKNQATRTPIEIPADLKNVYAVADHRTLQLRFGDTHVALRCAPHVYIQDGEAPPVEPDPAADVNVLLMHAAVRSSARPDALDYHYAGPHAPDIALIAEHFDAVLLGDYHEFTELVPGRSVFYSGSIERTSCNIWIERAPKGVAFVDTSLPGHVDFVPIDIRPMFSVNLTELNGGVPDAAAVNEHMQAALEDEGVEGSILRIIVPGFLPTERSGIDRRLERRLKAHALHFQLDTRAETGEPALGAGTARVGRTLADAAREHFKTYRADVRATALAFLEVEGSPADVIDIHSEHPIFSRDQCASIA